MQDIREADAIILGAPGRQGGMCGEMRLFLDSLAPLQVEKKGHAAGALKVHLSDQKDRSATEFDRCRILWHLLADDW